MSGFFREAPHRPLRTPTVHDVVSSPGRPLNPAIRETMESRLGHDFSRVRVHANARAAEAAQAMDAHAYTIGQDIVFGDGQYTPATAAGRQLLSHELAHVVQQGRGGPAPELDRSAAHEHQAKASAKAFARTTGPVTVTGATGVGVARQPKAAPVLSPELQAQVDDPQNSSRYIDNLFQSVGYKPFFDLFTFRWKENGKAMEIKVRLDRVFQNDAVSTVPIREVHATRQEADDTVEEWFLSGPSNVFYSFYRTPEGVIMPTLFSKDSAPQFHKLWPGLAAPDEKSMEALVQIGNAINPIPGTRVDPHGDVNISGDPFDWIALLHIRRTKIAKQAKVKGLDTGRVVTKTRTSIGITYHITGMADDFDAIKGISVYVLRDADGAVLYVGEGDVFDRLRSHIGNTKNTQKELWGPSIAQLEVHATDLTKVEALALEEDLIQVLKPKENGPGRDRKPFEKMHPGEDRAGRLPKGQKVRSFAISLGPTP
ncbi:MAG: eCIS core domain-containing protein [Pseudonocardiaceae bacterium]